MIEKILDTDRRILSLAFARMADSIGNSFLIVVLPLFIERIVSEGSPGVTLGFGSATLTIGSALATGVVLSTFGFLNSVVQPFSGRWSDRVGRRRVFILSGLAILGLTNLVYIWAGSFVSLFVIRAVQGLGVALTVPATIALVNELATEESRGGNMGVFNTFRLLGFGIGPVLAGTFVKYYGFDAAFAFAAAAAFIGFALVVILVEDPAQTRGEASDDLAIEIVNSEDGGGALDSVFTLGIASLFMAIGIALLAAIETDVNHHLGQSGFLFGVEFAAFTLAQVLTQVPVGSASDTYGRKPFIVAGLVVLVPATLAQGIVTTPLTMIAARFVQGVAGAMVFAPAFALAGDLARSGDSGTKLSILTMSFGLGTAIGPIASGWLVSYGYVVPFAFGATLAALGAVLVYTQVEETVDIDKPAPGAEPAD